MKNPSDAIRELASRILTVDRRQTVRNLRGYVLASDVVADRDSPAADVSAMDGYAIRLSQLNASGIIPIRGEAAAGAPPPAMQEDSVVRIFTGAIVPAGCEAVVKREDTEESEDGMRFRDAALKSQPGENIRKAGENAVGGSTVLEAGIELTAAHLATMANFGAFTADVYDPVKVTLITTGDEVGLFDNESPEPWQLRNSNQSSVAAVMDQHRWTQLIDTFHAKDDRQALRKKLHEALERSDAVFMTGGVSMGDYDYVPEVVQKAGGDLIFHGLPVRPGKPILGAATNQGKLIIGLPGNPVSATIGCHRFGLTLLAKMSGQTNWTPNCPVVRLTNANAKTIPLHWMRLVRLTQCGLAELVQSQGSGDLVSLGQSTGYVELPPNVTGEGPWPYFAW